MMQPIAVVLCAATGAAMESSPSLHGQLPGDRGPAPTAIGISRIADAAVRAGEAFGAEFTVVVGAPPCAADLFLTDGFLDAIGLIALRAEWEPCLS